MISLITSRRFCNAEMSTYRQALALLYNIQCIKKPAGGFLEKVINIKIKCSKFKGIYK